MEVDNVFVQGRPEFFLMVSGRTYAMLCGTLGPRNYRLRKPYNYLFKILFDCEFLVEYNENIYMPNGTGKPTKLYDMSKFYLLKVRPKLDIGIEDLENFQPDLLFHFVEMICSGDFHTKFIPVIEGQLPGVGFDMIKDHGLSVTTEMKDIKVEQIMPLFHCIISQKNFSTSGFIASAQLRKKNIEKEKWDEDSEKKS